MNCKNISETNYQKIKSFDKKILTRLFENQEMNEETVLMQVVEILEFENKLKIYIISIACCLKVKGNIFKIQHRR